MGVLKMVPLSDYISLQVELDRLRETILQLECEMKKNLQQKQEILNVKNHISHKTMVVKEANVNRIISSENVVMINASGNYSYVNLISGSKILTSKTLKYWEKYFSDCGYFLRVHKSYLINRNYVERVESKTGKLTMSAGLIAYSSMKLKDLLHCVPGSHTKVKNITL